MRGDCWATNSLEKMLLHQIATVHVLGMKAAARANDENRLPGQAPLPPVELGAPAERDGEVLPTRTGCRRGNAGKWGPPKPSRLCISMFKSQRAGKQSWRARSRVGSVGLGEGEVA
jgi:hypothetical protein